MTPQQRIDHEARTAIYAAPAQIRRTRQPDSAPHKILTSLNKSKSTPPGTPLPAKTMPAQKSQARQAIASSSSNRFGMTTLPGSALSTAHVQVAVTTPTPADTKVDIIIENPPPNTKQHASTPQQTDDSSHPDHNQQAPSSGSGTTPQDRAQQPHQSYSTFYPIRYPASIK
jgi:hypothetical protein